MYMIRDGVAFYSGFVRSFETNLAESVCSDAGSFTTGNLLDTPPVGEVPHVMWGFGTTFVEVTDGP